MAARTMKVTMGERGYEVMWCIYHHLSLLQIKLNHDLESRMVSIPSWLHHCMGFQLLIWFKSPKKKKKGFWETTVRNPKWSQADQRCGVVVSTCEGDTSSNLVCDISSPHHFLFSFYSKEKKKKMTKARPNSGIFHNTCGHKSHPQANI